MAICAACGREFDLSSVRRSCGQKYGAGMYDEYFPDGDICLDCAENVIGPDNAVGEEMQYYVYRDNDD